MKTPRWSTALAAAALIGLPIVASAQSTASTPTQNPPAQQAQPPASTPQQPSAQQPPAQQPPAQQPPTQQPPTEPPAATSASAGQVDANAAKTHLSAARDTLSQIASMPEASKLQGAGRAQVSQLISDFNALITTQSDWRAAYAKVDTDLTSILGSANPDQPVGTSGSAGAAEIDPAIRTKLADFRSHLKEFEKAAGGAAPAASPSPSAASAAAPPSGETPPSLATGSTSNPATPANPAAATSASPASPTASPASPTASMNSADRARAASEAGSGGNAEAQKELEAISQILDASKTGALTKAQTGELKKHVEILKALLAQK
jgi:hypothetical protein